MPVNLFVGGIPYEMTQAALTELFSACGSVTSVKLIMDRDTGRSKGFGFVELASEAEAQAAIAKLNGADIDGRKIFVSVARPQVKRPEPATPAGPGTSGFVERRAGLKDRRRPQPGAEEGRRPADKPWQDSGKREGFAGPRKWGPKSKGKPGGEKRRDFSGPKKWGPKPGGSGRKGGPRPA